MEIDKAIMAFSESEKIKEGLLWASQLLSVIQGLPAGEKKGGEKVASGLISMIGREVELAGAVSEEVIWEEIEPDIDNALTMIDSGVSSEATIHLSNALSKVTNIGHRSMSRLREEKLI